MISFLLTVDMIFMYDICRYDIHVRYIIFFVLLASSIFSTFRHVTLAMISRNLSDMINEKREILHRSRVATFSYTDICTYQAKCTRLS